MEGYKEGDGEMFSKVRFLLLWAMEEGSYFRIFGVGTPL